MLKAIIFDFDGVICESVDVKTEAFRKLFLNYPEHLDQIIKYHVKNGGLSRFKKFEFIYRDFFKKKLTANESARLGKNFQEYSLEGVIKSAFVKGAKGFLKKYHTKFSLFIVSGTPEKEMNFILKKRKLEKYFKNVYGSPQTKVKLIKRILKRYHLKKDEVIFVGDSINDYEGAWKAGIKFIGRVKSGQFNPFVNYRQVNGIVRDLHGLDALLTKKMILP